MLLTYNYKFICDIKNLTNTIKNHMKVFRYYIRSIT